VTGGHAGPAHEGDRRTMSMHADEESDEGIVPMKRSNNGSLLPAEIVEGRASPKENGGQATAVRTPSRGAASSRLGAVRQAARQDKKVRFTALLHHITVDLLKQSYIAVKRDAAPGTDGVTWQAYGETLDEKLKALHDRIHKGSYRTRPARRTYIPKADGSQRPLIPALGEEGRLALWRAQYEAGPTNVAAALAVPAPPGQRGARCLLAWQILDIVNRRYQPILKLRRIARYRLLAQN
jgi:hypothetical protein